LLRYRIHRIKETPRENFRWAPHTGGLAIVKPKDYDFEGEVEAASPYAVWKILQAQGRPLHPGDLLETSHADGASVQLQIAKYIGFEPAVWYVPEPRPGSDIASADVTESNSASLQSDPL
jgi:hypothetical protein